MERLPRAREANPRARRAGKVGGFLAAEGGALRAERLHWPGGATRGGKPGPRPASRTAGGGRSPWDLAAVRVPPLGRSQKPDSTGCGGEPSGAGAPWRGGSGAAVGVGTGRAIAVLRIGEGPWTRARPARGRSVTDPDSCFVSRCRHRSPRAHVLEELPVHLQILQRSVGGQVQLPEAGGDAALAPNKARGAVRAGGGAEPQAARVHSPAAPRALAEPTRALIRLFSSQSTGS